VLGRRRRPWRPCLPRSYRTPTVNAAAIATTTAAPAAAASNYIIQLSQKCGCACVIRAAGIVIVGVGAAGISSDVGGSSGGKSALYVSLSKLAVAPCRP